MATAKEKFLKLKEDAKLKKINLSLNEFGDSFSLIKDLFSDLILDVTNIDIISEAEDRFKIKAISKDFLFKSNVFKDRGVILEAEFSFSGSELEIFAICKLEKMPSKLSKLPGIIGDLLSPLDFIKIDSLIYVLTSKDISIIKSETFPEYNNKEVNFKPGINLAGFLDLKNSGSIASLVIKPLKPLMGEGPYFMSWNMKDKLDVDFSLSLPKDIELENIFTVKKPKLVLKPLKTPVISIDGIFDVKLPGVSVSLDGGFAFTTDGIRGKFKMDEIASKIKAPLGYVGVYLSTLTVSAGISNGIPIVGAEGDFYIGPDAPGDVSNKPAVKEFGGVRSNQYKFIFQALPGKIEPSFAYMYLDKLTLEEYLKAITNKNIELPAFLNKIAMEQVMFHWCETPQGEAKPDGTIALPIFGFSSILNIFGHKTYGEILVDSSSESKGKIIAAPINISNGLLKISGKGKGTPEKYKGSTKVEPGGMEFLFNSKGPDYFSFSAKIDILGLSTESSGKLSDNGITVNVKSNIVNIFKDELEVTLNDTNFEAKAGLDVGFKNKSITLPMDLGKLDFSTSVKGSFAAIYNKGVLKTKINAKFEIIGMDFNLGTIQLDTRDIKDIPNLLFKYIEENVEKIFADLLKDAELWLKAIKEKIIQIVDQLIGKALHDVYGIARDKIAPLVKTLLDFKPEQIAGVLKGAGENAANVIKALSDLDYPDKVIEGAIKTIFPDAKVNISLGHTDIPASLHIDKGAKGHIDEGARGHVDKGAKAHIDTRTGFHTDIGGSAHVDKSARLHVNESARAHVNTPLVPHIDTKNHIDI